MYIHSYTSAYIYTPVLFPMGDCISCSVHGRIKGDLSRSVYVVLAQYFEFIGLMDHLYELGLLDTGEYFVVGVCLADSDTITPDAYLTGNAAKNQSQESTA